MQQQRIDYSQYSSQPSSDLSHIPGDNGLPIFGHTLEFLRDNHALLNRGYSRHGLVYRRRVLFQNGISLLGPEANRQVLLDSQQCFSNYLAWSTVLDRIFPNGLMLKDFSDHRYHRRILQSAFKKPALESYLQPMGQHIAEGLTQWPRKQTFQFLPAVKSLLLDIAAQTFLGVELGDDAQAVNKAFVDAADASIAVIKRRIPGSRWATEFQTTMTWPQWKKQDGYFGKRCVCTLRYQLFLDAVFMKRKCLVIAFRVMPVLPYPRYSLITWKTTGAIQHCLTQSVFQRHALSTNVIPISLFPLVAVPISALV